MRLLLAALLTLMAGGSLAQTTMTITAGVCSCAESGKTWPCRRAIDYSGSAACTANASTMLICPKSVNDLCAYVNQPMCLPLNQINVCYEGDKP